MSKQQVVSPHVGKRRHVSLHIVVRFAAALIYLVLAVAADTPELLLALLVLLVIAALIFHVSWRALYVPLLTAFVLDVLALAHTSRWEDAAPIHLLTHFAPFTTPWVASCAQFLAFTAPLATSPFAEATILGIAKLVCLALVIGIFAAMTQTSELLNVFSAAGNSIPGTRPLMYLLSTTLAVLPSLQRDVARSVDVAILRGGGRATLAAPKTWGTILIDVLVRAVLRGQRMADAVVARGFRLSTGLAPLPLQRFHFSDLLVGLILIAPGAACYGALR